MAKPFFEPEDNVWLFTDNSLLPLKAVSETLNEVLWEYDDDNDDDIKTEIYINGIPSMF